MLVEKSFVSFDKAITKLDNLILAYEDSLVEAGIRLVSGKWQIWIKVESDA